ncbi:MAG: prephenate dehydrogenase [Bacteroidia bacterium]|nr:prephenate dehydrogenase [Bacteroidia bacterium]
MVIAIIGLGLIGGSMARDLRTNGFASKLLGVDQNPGHQEEALSLGLVDEITDLESACGTADIVLLTVPVSAMLNLIPVCLDLLKQDGVLIEMGSTKQVISDTAQSHLRRSSLVLAHPMAGTENSGPKAAVDHLFYGKAAIICDKVASEPKAIQLAERLFKSLFMRVLYMDSKEHDQHAAYVSHVSHITSFVLALTVLDKEKSEANIFNLASGGFASTVRLAKSSPRMWRDIYEQNAENLIDVLDNYLEKMYEFRQFIAEGNFDKTFQLMEEANKIRKILND